jgi:hypothetical protein
VSKVLTLNKVLNDSKLCDHWPIVGMCISLHDSFVFLSHTSVSYLYIKIHSDTSIKRTHKNYFVSVWINTWSYASIHEIYCKPQNTFASACIDPYESCIDTWTGKLLYGSIHTHLVSIQA